MSDVEMDLTHKPQRRGRRFLLGIVIGLLLVAAAAALFRWSKYRTVQAELARIRTAGQPLSLAEIERAELARPTNSANHFLQLALRSWVESTNLNLAGLRHQWKEHQSFDEEVRGQISQLLVTNNAALNYLELALTNEALILNLQWSAGHNLAIPHLPNLRRIADLLGCAALFELDRDNLDECLRRIEQVLLITRWIEKEPTYLSQLYRSALLAAGCDLIEQMLARNSPPPERAKRFQALLRRATDLGLVRRALETSRVFGLQVYAQGANAGPLPGLSPTEFGTLSAIGWMEADKALFLDMHRGMIEACALPLPQAVVQARALKAEFNRQTAEPRHDSEFYKSFRFRPSRISTMFVPPLFSTFDTCMGSTTRSRLAMVALELNMMKQETGEYPGALPLDREAIKEATVDPYTGRPLRLKTLTSGFMLYSTGPDQVDDGGKRRVSSGPGKSPENNSYDLVFEVEAGQRGTE